MPFEAVRSANGFSDGFRALNDEWAAFSYHKSHNKDQEEAALASRARA